MIIKVLFTLYINKTPSILIKAYQLKIIKCYEEVNYIDILIIIVHKRYSIGYNIINISQMLVKAVQVYLLTNVQS